MREPKSDEGCSTTNHQLSCQPSTRSSRSRTAGTFRCESCGRASRDSDHNDFQMPQIPTSIACCFSAMARTSTRSPNSACSGSLAAGRVRRKKYSSRLQLARVREVAAIEGPDVGSLQRDDGHSLAGQRHELHFIGDTVSVDMHNRADVASSRFSSGRFVVSTTQSCSLIISLPPEDTHLSNAAQPRPHPFATRCARADSGQRACSIPLPPRIAGRTLSPASAPLRACDHARATLPPTVPIPRCENQTP
jgi:hypothetical protein